MNINWMLRLQNKTTLMALLVAVITFVYAVLALVGVTPSITQEQIMNIVVAAVSALVALGVVVDPTTEGIGDSERAMSYEEPYRKEG